MVGPPINFWGSDTYHMSTLIGTYEYVLHSGDVTFLRNNWDKIALGVSFVAFKMEAPDLMLVTGAADWGRRPQGGHNTPANAMLYRTFITATAMANWIGKAGGLAWWMTRARALKAAINSPNNNWDANVGYVEIHPQSVKTFNNNLQSI